MKTNALRVALLLSLAVLSLPMAAQPLGTVDMNLENVTLDLNSVERKGNVLTVKWTVHNKGDKTATVQFPLTGKQNVTTYLVDEENGTKYYALTDKEGNTLASEHVYIGGDAYGISEYVEPGKSVKYWAKFPAPPPAVKSINLLFSKAEPLEGIAITEKK
jgi:hypothetical protein